VMDRRTGSSKKSMSDTNYGYPRSSRPLSAAMAVVTGICSTKPRILRPKTGKPPSLSPPSRPDGWEGPGGHFCVPDFDWGAQQRGGG
jgi:hypothetical protein